MLMLVDFIVENVVNVDNVVNSICRLKHILQLAYTKCSLSILVDFTVVDVVKCCVKSISLPNTIHQYFTRFYNSVKDSPIFYKIL
jgi:hypothetical protein